ncbi:MAG: hypothetical protein LKM37_04880 [Bacteroidales bacterium]|jgi:hypothetical protein|nr:hypothetical protein [Bacteroidales bacterium]MCI1733844.1 hypothetical protein [Bacteroidales bacterium]
MKNFTEITEYEAITVAGGRDPNVAKLIELIGYGVGALMRYLSKLNKRNQTAFLMRISQGSPYPAR